MFKALAFRGLAFAGLAFAGLALTAAAGVSPAKAQEGYIEVSGIADFTYGDGVDTVVLTDRPFRLGAYVPYADYDAGTNSFSGQTFFLGIDGLWDNGETWIIGGLSVSSPPRVSIGSIMSFSIPADVPLFVEGENRFFIGTGTDFTGFADVATTAFSISMTRTSDVVLRLDFSESAPIPEPATWGMMILGFGMVGFGLRRRAKIDLRRREPPACAAAQ